jgi:hypothetical protein
MKTLRGTTGIRDEDSEFIFSERKLFLRASCSEDKFTKGGMEKKAERFLAIS